MAYAKAIIDKFGGTRAMADTLKVPPSTVQSWKDNGFIPTRRHQLIFDKAREKNIALSPADFFDVPNTDETPLHEFEPLKHKAAS